MNNYPDCKELNYYHSICCSTNGSNIQLIFPETSPGTLVLMDYLKKQTEFIVYLYLKGNKNDNWFSWPSTKRS